MFQGADRVEAGYIEECTRHRAESLAHIRRGTYVHMVNMDGRVLQPGAVGQHGAHVVLQDVDTAGVVLQDLTQPKDVIPADLQPVVSASSFKGSCKTAYGEVKSMVRVYMTVQWGQLTYTSDLP